MLQHKRGSLVKVAFVLTELSDRYLLHELQASAHAWRHFLPEVILLNIRWYCRYALSYRNHRRDDAGEGAKRRSYDGISVGAGTGMTLAAAPLLRWLMRLQALPDN